MLDMFQVSAFSICSVPPIYCFNISIFYAGPTTLLVQKCMTYWHTQHSSSIQFMETLKPLNISITWKYWTRGHIGILCIVLYFAKVFVASKLNSSVNIWNIKHNEDFQYFIGLMTYWSGITMQCFCWSVDILTCCFQFINMPVTLTISVCLGLLSTFNVLRYWSEEISTQLIQWVRYGQTIWNFQYFPYSQNMNRFKLLTHASCALAQMLLGICRERGDGWAGGLHILGRFQGRLYRRWSGVDVRALCRIVEAGQQIRFQDDCLRSLWARGHALLFATGAWWIPQHYPSEATSCPLVQMTYSHHKINAQPLWSPCCPGWITFRLPPFPLSASSACVP